MRSPRGLSSAVLTMEAMLIALCALTSQFGDESTIEPRWLWTGLVVVLVLYLATAGQRDSVRLRMLGWVAQAATMAYAIWLGGFLPYLCALFVVFWFYTAKAIRLMAQAAREHGRGDADSSL